MSSIVVAARAGLASLLVVSTLLLAGCVGSSSDNPPTAPPDATSVTPATGPAAGGTAVVVAGTGFASGATVTFGGVAGTVTAVAGNLINVTTPAGAAGPVAVVVRNPDGQTDTLPTGFTYQVAAPAPDAVSVTPNVGTTAGGTAVVVAGAGFAAGVTVAFGGTAGTVTNVTSNAIEVTTPAGAAGAVDVVVTNTDTQADTLPGAFTYQTPPVDALWVVPDLAANLTTGAGGQVEAFQAGGLYVNAHTAGHPTGELRGQLDNAGTVVRLASLDAAQESATMTSSGFGGGILQVDTATGKVSGFVVTSGLVNISNAHVHRALRTVPPTPGGVVIGLVPAGAKKDVWVVPDTAAALSQTLIDAFVAGEFYYNIHTAANTGGEIRGQLDKAGTMKLATLDGVQEGNASTAFGAGIMAVNVDSGAVAGFAVTSGLTGVTVAHVHAAARGASAGPVVSMTVGPSLVVIPDTAANLAPAQVTNFLNDGHYFNVHTAAFAAGEIRGQVDKTGSVRVTAMDGAQEAPTPVTTTAVGAGLVAVDDATGEVSGFILTRGLVSPNVAHIHQAARGAGGGPIVALDGP